MVLLRLLAFQPAGQRVLAEKKSLKPPVEPQAPAAQQHAGLVPLPVREPPPVMAPLPVVDAQVPKPPEFSEPNAAQTLSSKAQAAIETVALEVRVPPAPTQHERLDAPLPLPANVPRHTPLSKPPSPAPSASAEGDFWFDLVTEMARAETVGALVRELALQSQLLARDDSASPAHWMLRVENASLNQPGTRDRLQAALVQHGHNVRLAVEVGMTTDTPARRQAAAAAQRQEAAERSIRQDPFVQTLLRDFGGKIVPGTLRPLGPQA